jgi:casein kinase I homolog HRR25
MIHSLEVLHKHNYVHRDIKPENFVVGNDGNHHIIYLIDFGLSKKYLDEKNKHIPFVEGKGLVGTARYTSINSHLGTE